MGMHNFTRCEEYGDFGMGGETKVDYNSPWAMFGTKYTRYKCLDCGRKFWYPKGDFEMRKATDKLLSNL